jgi:hypothetical protein
VRRDSGGFLRGTALADAGVANENRFTCPARCRLVGLAPWLQCQTQR